MDQHLSPSTGQASTGMKPRWVWLRLPHSSSCGTGVWVCDWNRYHPSLPAPAEQRSPRTKALSARRGRGWGGQSAGRGHSCDI